MSLNQLRGAVLNVFYKIKRLPQFSKLKLENI